MTFDGSLLEVSLVKADFMYVTNEDKRFWFELDKHLPEAEFEKKVRDRQGYVLFEDNEPSEY